MYISEKCHWTPYGTDPDTDERVDSTDTMLRRSAAIRHYGLEKLINDEDWVVRMMVAQRGYGLDELINDENDCVRGVIAEQGYGLNKLINDSNDYIKYVVVHKYLKQHGYTSIKDWADTNPDKVYSKYWETTSDKVYDASMLYTGDIEKNFILWI